MKTTGLITDSYSSKIQKIENKFLILVSIIGVIVLGVYAYLNYSGGNEQIAYIEFGLSLFLLISLISLLTTNNTLLTKIAGAVVLVALVMNNTLTGGFGEQGLLWSYVFPAIIFFLLGSKHGLYTSLFLFTLLSSILSLQPLGHLSTPYSGVELGTHLVSLIVITLMIYIYQSSNEQNQDLTEEINRRLVATNRELTKQSEQYNSSQKKLYEVNRNLEKQGEYIENMQDDILNLRKKVERINS